MAINKIEKYHLLNDFVQSYAISEQQPSIVIDSLDVGLEMKWLSDSKQVIKFKLEAGDALLRLQSFPAPKQGAFNQAIGKSSNTVLDVTAGWGNDSWLMCSQGYQVTMLERNPIMVLLLKDHLRQVEEKIQHSSWPVILPTVLEVNSIDYLKSSEIDVDCIYIDPMFPPKRKKSAATNKYMTFLKSVVGQDIDSVELAEAAYQSGAKRLVVKRPDYAEPLLGKPDEQFHSKLLHYDVYFPR